MIRRLLLVIAMILLSGCISMEVTHIQNADGSAEIAQATDVSVLSASEAYGETIKAALSESCSSYGGVECDEDEGVITLSKHFGKDEVFYRFERMDDFLAVKYRLTIDELPDFSKYSSEGVYDSSLYGSDYTSPYEPSYDEDYSDALSGTTRLSEGKAIGKMMDQVGMGYTYKVRMPGTITYAPDAEKIDGDAAEFDVVQLLQEERKIVVESEESDTGAVFILGIIVLLAIVAAAILGIRMMSGRGSI